MHLCITTVYSDTFICFIHNCSYRTDQLCSYQKIEVKNWKNVTTLQSAVKRCNQTTGKLCCINANWAAIAEGLDALDIMLNVLHFITIIHVA